MSDLPGKIQEAIDAHLAETGGGMVVAWHFIADFIAPDGDTGWIYSTPNEQRQMTTLGLIKWALGVAEYEQAKYLSENDD